MAGQALPLVLGTLVLRPFQAKDAPPTRARRRTQRTPRSSGSAHTFGEEPGVLPPDAASASVVQGGTSAEPYYLGLYNRDVFCFMNSVVQSLGSIALLAHHLDALTAMAERYDVTTPVTDALRELLVVLNTPQKRRGALAPKNLIQVLGTLSQSNGMRTLLSVRQQQDAQELALLLMDALDQELGKVQAEHGAQWDELHAGLAGLIAPSTKVANRLRSRLDQDGVAAVNPFRGVSAQRTSCTTCGYTEAVRYFATTDLGLAIPTRHGACTLAQCLHVWSQLEHVAWICHRCSIRTTLARERAEVQLWQTPASPDGKRRARSTKLAAAQDRVRRLTLALTHKWDEAEVEEQQLFAGIQMIREPNEANTKQVMLAKPPPVLVLHLNRSSYTMGGYPTKNNTRVVFPLVLDVTPYTTGAVLSTNPTHPLSHATATASANMYRLCAVVVHYGGHQSGHYVSYRRRPHSWTRISDDRVENCTEDDVLAQNPYLLFYEQIDALKRTAPTPFVVPQHVRGGVVHQWTRPS